MLRRAPVVASVLVGFAFAACQSGIPRENEPRFDYPIPPDAEADAVAVPPSIVLEDSGAGDAGAIDASIDADAGPPPIPDGPLLATGSSFHPTASVGNGDHTCVALPESGVFCWGANEHGQLGIGTSTDAKTAQKITVDENGLPFGDVNELALAGWHSCARKGEQLFCWGQRFSSAQAEAPLPNGPDRLAPRAIGNLAIRHVATGGPHTCVIESSGRHVCFGHGTCGELGGFAGDTSCSGPIFYPYQGEPTHACSESLVPIDPVLPKLGAIAAGEIHSCAITLGRVFCWGANQAQQLGRVAFSQDPIAGPVSLDARTTLDGATALAAGGKHSCAIANGSVICWGDGLAPKTVAGITDPTAIGVADGNACALQADGTVVCWDDTLVRKAVPLTGVKAIAPGMNHSCAQKTDGSVWCWGKNDRGQLGDGTGVDSSTPVKVSGLPP